MTQKLHIGNLNFDTTEAQVRQMCEPFGEVTSIAMITDRESGRFRGFCFVEMEDAGATKAIAALHGKEVAGRAIKVSIARPRKGQPQGRRQGKSQGKSQQRPGQQSKGKSKSQSQSQSSIPLHERSGRGAFGPDGDRFPNSGGNRRGNPGEFRQRDEDNKRNDNSQFPNSGGGSRRNR